MSNAKIFMALLVFYVLCQMWCNLNDGFAMFTSSNVADLNSATSASVTNSTDSSGTPAQYVAMGSSFFTTIGKVVFFDYSLFRNKDGTANDFSILRYILICLGLVILIDSAIVFRQIIAG